MRLILRITRGPLQGQIYSVKDGLVFGRQDADIVLNDSKVSSSHARISQEGERWVLRDSDSKNGVRGENGERLDAVELTPGVTFHIGDSSFEVAAAPSAQGPVPERKKKKKQRTWNDVLAGFLEVNAAQFEDKQIPLIPLEPALILEFVRGVQVNSKWILGFGPRRIGISSLDLPIWEPGTPPVCFEIHPTPDGLMFKTDHPNIVHLNGRGIDNQVLRMGDTIQIQETLIEVDFVE